MSKQTEALKLALEALEIYATAYSDGNEAITAIREALAEQPAQQQEPVELFKWLPEGATHIGRISVRTCAGGSLAMVTHAFKYDNEVLKVYVTDNDNEYPGWRDAKECFFHLNFPVIPLYTSPPDTKPWVGLTDCEREKLRWEAVEEDAGYRELINATEAKLREKNNG